MMNLFQETLTAFVHRARYSAGQLAELTGIPKRTIANWLGGRVNQPRRWQEVLLLAAALHLSAAETDELLQAAGHETLAMLRQVDQPADEQALLAHWTVKREAPFQAIADLPYFVGRVSLLQEMATALRHGQQVTMTSLRGMGGVGKSSLAARLAYQLREHFTDGVLWARLDTSDTMSILAAFAAAYDVDVTQHRDISIRASAVRGVLAGKRVLIILDNAEQSAQVRPLLPPSTENIGVIVTTRHDLAISDQMMQVIVEPFATQGDEALSLFSRFLGARMVRRWHKELREITVILGGLPLALAIAAGRLTAGMSITAYLAQLRTRESQLDALVREDRSVRLSFDVTFAALPEPLKAFFITLGVFGGGDFSVAAVAYVADVTEGKASAALDQLASLSLVQPAGVRRFAVHPLLLAYAREKQTTPQAEERMVVYYIQHTVTQQDDIQLIKRELDNIVFALDTAREQETPTLLVEGVLALSPTWRTLGNQLKAIPYLEQALNSVRETASKYEEAKISLELGSSYWAVGRFQEAQTIFKQGEKLAVDMNDDELLGRLLVNLGVISAYNEGDYENAIHYLKQGLTYARASGREALQGLALSNLANAYFEQGEWEKAGRYWEEGLQVMKAQGREDSAEYVRLLHNMGILAIDRGEFAHANTLLQETLVRAQSIGFAELQGKTQAALGRLAYEQGLFDQARALLTDALSQARQVKLPEVTTIALCHLATLSTYQGDMVVAVSYLDEAESLAESANIPWLLVDIAVRRGELMLRQGTIESAQSQFATAVDAAQASNLLELEAFARFGLARALGEMMIMDTAVSHAHTALTMLSDMGHFKVKQVQQWFRQHQ